MKRFLNILSIAVFFSATALMAQDEKALSNDSLSKELKLIKTDVDAMKNLKITGWIQAQFQYAQTRGAANFDGGTFAANSDKRFMIRRGRIKFTYNGKNSQYVMQLNGSERGFNLVEAYITATDPWKKTFSLTAGVMNRPFGFEIDQSSSVRETPERSRYTQILMPNERDLGVKVVIAPPKGSKFHGFRLDAGMFNGQGIYVPGTSTPPGYAAGTSPMLGVNEFDFQKDFIGRMCYYSHTADSKINYGIGVSHYRGGNMYQNNRVFEDISTSTNNTKMWTIADTSNKLYTNKTAPRIYYGAEYFFSIKTSFGTTTIRGEYITGTQSGTSGSSGSPFFLLSSKDTYIRHFDGMYVYLIQRLGKSKHEFAVKYEWYDPNTKVKGSDIFGATINNLGAADIKYTQLGFGYNYYMYENVKFMVFYNIITNETTGNSSNSLAGFSNDIKDNILTVRMQYKF